MWVQTLEKWLLVPVVLTLILVVFNRLVGADRKKRR